MCVGLFVTKRPDFPLCNSRTKCTRQLTCKVCCSFVSPCKFPPQFLFFSLRNTCSVESGGPGAVPVTGCTPHQFPLPERYVARRKPGLDPPAVSALCLTHISRRTAKHTFPSFGLYPALPQQYGVNVKALVLTCLLRGLSPQANYTDRATEPCRRS
jgi:hypothetical protein